jgi:hypothetical protein
MKKTYPGMALLNCLHWWMSEIFLPGENAEEVQLPLSIIDKGMFHLPINRGERVITAE